MKTYLWLCIALVMLGLGSITAQAQCNNRYSSNIQCSYFDEGHRDGGNDARNYQSNDYRRHRNKFEKKYEAYYKAGYEEGYLNSGFPNTGGTGGYVRWTGSQRNAYDSGYEIGQNDRRRSSSARVPDSYGRYDSSISLYFQQGYNDGFAGIGRRYDFRINDNGGWPGNGWPGNGGGNNSGTATWTGRVDDRANIIIRGRNIRTEDVSGTGVQIYTQNVNGSLPSRNVDVRADKRSGRGNVYVIQQPARNNGWTAIIQISDTRGGAADYSVDISWSPGGNNNGSGWGNSGGNEQYQSGRVIWRGRVDQKANIRIGGSYVDTEDDAGTGLSNVRFDITGFLARRDGNVQVRKRSGRGSVAITQQPSRWNDYTAVIQVFDPSGGADDYEVEISW